MQVTHVVTLGDYPPAGVLSGAERHLWLLLQEQVQAGLEVELLALIFRHGPRLRQELQVLRGAGVRVEEVLLPGGWRWRLDFWLGLLPRLRGRRGRVIHTHLDTASLLLRPLAWLAGCRRLVDTIHNDEPYFKHWLIRRVLLAWDRFTGMTISISERIRGYLLELGYPPHKVRRIYYGVHPPELETKKALRQRLGLPQRAFVCGFVGRLVEQKNLSVFLKALAAAGKDIQGVLIGEGPLRQSLELQAEELCPGRVHFLGQIDRAGAMMPAFDVFVLPSSWEGLGLVLLEAMQAGVPIVASDRGAIPEITAGGRYAQLCPHDDPQAFAEAFQAVKEDRKHWKEVAARSREYVAEDFSPQRMVAETLEVYREV